MKKLEIDKFSNINNILELVELLYENREIIEKNGSILSEIKFFNKTKGSSFYLTYNNDLSNYGEFPICKNNISEESVPCLSGWEGFVKINPQKINFLDIHGFFKKIGIYIKTGAKFGASNNLSGVHGIYLFSNDFKKMALNDFNDFVMESKNNINFFPEERLSNIIEVAPSIIDVNHEAWKFLIQAASDLPKIHKDIKSKLDVFVKEKNYGNLKKILNTNISVKENKHKI